MFTCKCVCGGGDVNAHTIFCIQGRELETKNEINSFSPQIEGSYDIKEEDEFIHMMSTFLTAHCLEMQAARSKFTGDVGVAAGYGTSPTHTFTTRNFTVYY